MAALSAAISITPTRAKAMYNSSKDSTPTAKASDSARRVAPLSTFGSHISSRRSTRSTITPTGTTNSIRTPEYTRASPAIKVGFVVIEVATRGMATKATPSAMLPAALPDHSHRKSRPREDMGHNLSRPADRSQSITEWEKRTSIGTTARTAAEPDGRRAYATRQMCAPVGKPHRGLRGIMSAASGRPAT